LSIGYANICSSAQDHRKKFSVFKYIGSGRTNESNDIYKMEACVARKRLKKKGSEDKRFWTSSETDIIKSTSSEIVHQKLTSSEVLKIIINWQTGSFRFVSNAVIITPNIAEEEKPEATANSEEFEGIWCLFFGERWKRTIVQVYNHYLHYSDLCMHCTRTTVVSTLVFLYTCNGFEIVPS